MTAIVLFMRRSLCTALLCITAATAAQQPATEQRPVANANEAPRIQLAILLDTSSSMDGLLDQTRAQLWRIVNDFAQSRRNGVQPRLEVAVIEYGNDSLPADSGYLRQVTNLTPQLDKVSEALFSLRTNGGSEYCGYAIQHAVGQLQWSQSDTDIKAIFIAGNEPFTQGPVDFRKAIAAAIKRGITVNTIHAGDYAEGAQTGWKEAAMLASGNYAVIDQNRNVAQVAAPQDQRIAELNQKLNQTYVPYGSTGGASLERQQQQDEQNKRMSAGQLAERAKTKASAFYDNADWDLVDGVGKGQIDLEKVDKAALPAALQPMSPKERREYVAGKTEERRALQKEIDALSTARADFLAKQQQAAGEADTMNDALTSAVRKQGEAKGFAF